MTNNNKMVLYCCCLLPSIVALTACKGKAGSTGNTDNPGGSAKLLQVITLDPDQYGYQFGQGINSLTSEPKLASCITFESPNSTMGSEGARGTVSIDTIKTTKEFHEKIGREYGLNIGKSASANPLSTIQKLSGKASMTSKSLSETHINREYSYALLKAEKVWMPRYIQNVRIKPEIISKYSALPKKHKQFFDECGDSFIFGTKFTSHVYALLECETSSIETKNVLERKLEASIGFDSISGGGNLATSLDKAIKETNATCRALVEYSGGNGTIASAEPLEAFRSAISYVNTATLQNAIPTELEVRKYKQIQDGTWTSFFKPWGWTLNFPTQEMYINYEKTRVNALSLEINNLEKDIQKYTAQWDYEKLKQLTAKKVTAIEQLVANSRDLFLCAENPITAGYCGDQGQIDENEQPIFEDERK